MKQVYFYRADGYYDHMDVIKDDEQVPANATTLVPEGLYPRFDGTKWNPITREEFDRINPPTRQATPQQPAQPANPSAQDQLNAQTQLQLAQLMQQSKSQAQLNAKLTIDIAMLKQELSKDSKAQD